MNDNEERKTATVGQKIAAASKKRATEFVRQGIGAEMLEERIFQYIMRYNGYQIGNISYGQVIHDICWLSMIVSSDASWRASANANERARPYEQRPSIHSNEPCCVLL